MEEIERGGDEPDWEWLAGDLRMDAAERKAWTKRRAVTRLKKQTTIVAVLKENLVIFHHR